MNSIHAVFSLIILVGTPGPKGYAVFDQDPAHPWNQLHSVFFTRTATDGTDISFEEVDPPLAPSTVYLLASPTLERVVDLLDDFIENSAATLIDDPLKRAIFQHDLWAVFDWSAEPDGSFQKERRALQTRLSVIIRQLALTREQIEALPDNHRAAISSGQFPAAYNSNKRDTAFMPMDLGTSPSSWHLLARELVKAPVIAPEHVEAAKGRSIFLVFMRVPGGSGATARYIRELQEFPKPWVLSDYFRQFPRGGPVVFHISPDLPQFPKGTQFALVRKAMLIDLKGSLVPSPITESVQIRVYRVNPAKAAYRALENQDVYEFELSRKDLFDGICGGLRPISKNDRRFMIPPFGFGHIGQSDPFETDQPILAPLPRLGTCYRCHSDEGIFSVLSYTGRQTFRHRRPPRFSLTAYPSQEQERTVLWKQQHYSWGLLQGLWE